MVLVCRGELDVSLWTRAGGRAESRGSRAHIGVSGDQCVCVCVCMCVRVCACVQECMHTSAHSAVCKSRADCSLGMHTRAAEAETDG